jgi:hypothetical protein
MSEREQDALDLLRRIYNVEADTPMYDDGMVVNWTEGQIAAFIRKYGPFEATKGTT